MTLGLVAFIASVGLFAAPSAHGAKRCGKVTSSNGYSDTTFKVRVKSTSCKKGRKTVKRAWASGKLMGPGNRVKIGAFRCRYVDYFGVGNVAIRCKAGKKGRKVVKGLWTPEPSP